MNIYLGNLTFEQTIERTGYELNEEDKKLWKQYHNDKADLSGMDTCFHVFDMPLFIKIKGGEMKGILLKMFTPEKLKSPKGRFGVGY